jgi:hypothetical protein
MGQQEVSIPCDCQVRRGHVDTNGASEAALDGERDEARRALIQHPNRIAKNVEGHSGRLSKLTRSRAMRRQRTTLPEPIVKKDREFPSSTVNNGDQASVNRQIC